MDNSKSETKTDSTLSQGKCFQIHLDKYTAKTLYRDDMYIPTYDLAVALAEEWASQPCKF